MNTRRTISTSNRTVVCRSCFRVFGSSCFRCTCGSDDVLKLSHEDGKMLSSFKGKNKEKKQRRAAILLISKDKQKKLL